MIPLRSDALIVIIKMRTAHMRKPTVLKRALLKATINIAIFHIAPKEL
jgi:hypothetical protein